MGRIEREKLAQLEYSQGNTNYFMAFYETCLTTLTDKGILESADFKRYCRLKGNCMGQRYVSIRALDVSNYGIDE